jgi:hypothetical protein
LCLFWVCFEAVLKTFKKRSNVWQRLVLVGPMSDIRRTYSLFYVRFRYTQNVRQMVDCVYRGLLVFIVHSDVSSSYSLFEVSSYSYSMSKRDIRANHKCKPNLARPKTQRFFQFRGLKEKFDFINIQRVNQNSFFLKIQISSLI